MRPRAGQRTFSDVFSDLVIRPRNWLSLESLTRYDIHDGLCRLSFHNLTLQPNETWSWGIGHLYVRDDFGATPTALQGGNSFLTSTLFLRANENWGFRDLFHIPRSEELDRRVVIPHPRHAHHRGQGLRCGIHLLAQGLSALQSRRRCCATRALAGVLTKKCSPPGEAGLNK